MQHDRSEKRAFALMKNDSKMSLQAIQRSLNRQLRKNRQRNFP